MSELPKKENPKENTAPQPEPFHGGDALVRALHAEGVDYVFGIPGGEFIPFLEALDRWGLNNGMHYIGVRHEEAAANMADAYTRVSGKVSVVCATIGPGFANMIPGIAPAFFDSVPILAIHPQMDQKFEDHDRLQAGIDQLAMMRPIVKYQKTINDPNRVIWGAQKCFKELMSGRPRPVQLEVREDAFHAQVEEYGRVVLQPHQYRAIEPPAGNSKDIEKACEILTQAAKPLIISGGGVTSSNGWEILRKLSLEYKIPVITTVMGIGTMSSNHETFIGSTLATGGVMQAASEADVVLALGTKFGYTIGYGKPPLWNPKAKVIQVDIDPLMLGKNRPIEVGIIGDCRVVLEQIYAELALRKAQMNASANWLPDLKKGRQASIDQLKSKMTSEKVPTHPLKLVADVTGFMDPEDILISDAGDITSMTVSNVDIIKPRAPRTFLTSIGFGHLGVGIPYAIGAKLAKPKSNVYIITGDGSFLFNIQELYTAVHYKIPFVCVVADNCSWGMIKNNEKMKWKNRAPFCVDFEDSDYVSIAKGFGCYAEKVEDPKEIKSALQRALDSKLPSVIVVPIQHVAPDSTRMMASFRNLKF